MPSEIEEELAPDEGGSEEGGLTEDGEEVNPEDDEQRAVASSMVSSWGYNREAEQIEVNFINGHTASYDCSPDQWAEAKEASSPGRWMHQNILG